MKLRDWIDFNFNNEQFNNNLGDIYVNVYKHKSYGTNDRIFKQLMKLSDIIHLFGDYELFHVGKETQDGYCTISIFIYKVD